MDDQIKAVLVGTRELCMKDETEIIDNPRVVYGQYGQLYPRLA